MSLRWLVVYENERSLPRAASVPGAFDDKICFGAFRDPVVVQRRISAWALPLALFMRALFTHARAREDDRLRDLVRVRDLALDLLAAQIEMVKIGGLLLTRDIDKNPHEKSLSELYGFLSQYSHSICMLWFSAGAKLLFGNAELWEERIWFEDFFRKKSSDKILSSYVLAAFKDSRIKGDDPPFEALRLVKATSGRSDSTGTSVSARGED